MSRQGVAAFPRSHRPRLPVLVLGLALVALTAPVRGAERERVPSRARLKKLIARNGEAAEEWLWTQAKAYSCEGPWSCGSDLEQRKAEAERLFRMYLEFFKFEGGAIRVHLFYGHQLFALQDYRGAAWHYEEAARLLSSAKDPASLNVQKRAAYLALGARAHAAGLGGRPLALPQHALIRERLLAWAAGTPLPPPPEPRQGEALDDVLATANQLLSLHPPKAEVAYAAMLAGHVHYLKGETAQAEARLQRLLDRMPQALDTWSLTPLLLDCMVRNGKGERARRLARQLLEQPLRRWWAAVLLEWDQARGRALRDVWRPVFEALARSGEKTR